MALVELTLGIVLGNVLGVVPQQWLTLLAGFAAIVLTLLAGILRGPIRRDLGGDVLRPGVDFSARSG